MFRDDQGRSAWSASGPFATAVLEAPQQAQKRTLYVSVATDILPFHLSHQNLSTSVSQWSRTPGHLGLANVGALRAEGVHVPCGHISLCRYAPYEIVVTPRCKAHDPQQIWGLGVPVWGNTNIISHPATCSTWYSRSWLSLIVSSISDCAFKIFIKCTRLYNILIFTSHGAKICDSTWILGLTYQRLCFFSWKQAVLHSNQEVAQAHVHNTSQYLMHIQVVETQNVSAIVQRFQHVPPMTHNLLGHWPGQPKFPTVKQPEELDGAQPKLHNSTFRNPIFYWNSTGHPWTG